MREQLRDIGARVYVRAGYLLERHQSLVLFAVGAFLLLHNTGADSFAAGAGSGFNDRKYGQICKAILDIHAGDFGALLTSLAGIGAIVASAMGGFKMAWGLLVVSLGSFLLQEYQEMWFDSCG